MLLLKQFECWSDYGPFSSSRHAYIHVSFTQAAHTDTAPTEGHFFLLATTLLLL